MAIQIALAVKNRGREATRSWSHSLVGGRPQQSAGRLSAHVAYNVGAAAGFPVLNAMLYCPRIRYVAPRRYYEDNELMRYWKHHTGHAIWLRYHEGAFLELGDHTELQAGMVFTVEPGLYASELGGFRHSDTVIISEDGSTALTYYPRDLEDLTIPV